MAQSQKIRQSLKKKAPNKKPENKEVSQKKGKSKVKNINSSKAYLIEADEEKALKSFIDETLSTALNDEDIRKELMGEKHKGSIVTEEICCGDHDHGDHHESEADGVVSKSETSFSTHMSKEEYFDLLNQVLDPETGIGIVDMGLIYDIQENSEGLITVTMTLTSMGCPAGPQLTTDIDGVLRLQEHVKDVQINIVWEPAWSPDKMNPKVREMLWGY